MFANKPDPMVTGPGRGLGLIGYAACTLAFMAVLGAGAIASEWRCHHGHASLCTRSSGVHARP